MNTSCIEKLEDVMNENIFYVVGEKFENFSTNKHVMTVSELEKLASINRIGSLPNYTFIIGQGVRADKLERLLNNINKYGHNNYLSIVKTNVLENKINQTAVHKSKLENVMITSPIHLDERKYISQLTIQDNAAEMSDHVTGQHIQGMVLIEAARQMMLSVSENHILTEDRQSNYSFVLNSVNTTFYQFAFPLEISIICEVINLEIKAKGSLKSVMKFSFIQNNMKVTEVEINFIAFEKTFLEAKEKSFAMKAITTAMELDAKKLAAITSAAKSTIKHKICL
jgi:hypothetical protein